MEAMTRRALFASAIAAVASVVARAVPGVAANGQPVVIGGYNQGTAATTIVGAGNSGATIGEAGWALGARNDAANGTGVRGIGNGTGAVGVAGEIGSQGAVAVRGETTGGAGQVAVRGNAKYAGIGVEGIGGYGGVFSGGTQLRMVPSGSGSHPASGARGDLFVDAKGRLWFCKGGSNWRQLA